MEAKEKKGSVDMTQSNIAINLYEMGGEYDVEVYSWIDELNIRGQRDDELSYFGAETKEEALSIIEELKTEYGLQEYTETSEDDDSDEDEYGTYNFWSLVNMSLKHTRTLDEQRIWIIKVLSKMSNEFIDQFDEELHEEQSRVQNHKKFNKIYRLAGAHGGDDSYMDCAAWVISRGKDAVEKILEDPYAIYTYMTEESLDEYDSGLNELFSYVASYARDAKGEPY